MSLLRRACKAATSRKNSQKTETMYRPTGELRKLLVSGGDVYISDARLLDTEENQSTG